MAEIVTLSIKDFRAIKEANIKLNGITVVSGANGSGKSTISKFLYYTFLKANSYEELVQENLLKELSYYESFLGILRDEISDFNPKKGVSHLPGYEPVLLERSALLSLIRKFRDDYCEIQKQYPEKTQSGGKRLTRILQNTLNNLDDSLSFSELIDELVVRVNKAHDVADEALSSRPISLLLRKLSEVFVDSTLPGEFEVLEYGDLIIGDKSKKVSRTHTVQKIAYIDTPMSIGVQTFEFEGYWADLNKILKYHRTKDKKYNYQIDDTIKSEILQGESRYENGDISNGPENFYDRFTFASNDGSVYNLLECATGVKSFSILQLMLRNGFLTPNTLLIIDEPEAHLHPQWIVEYARLIVLLNKYIGVNFFIASHSPDMVSAIKYISEKEKRTTSLNYYLAEQVDKTNLYTYKDLGTDINPIFESFNIALDRINLYGVGNEDNDIF